MQAALNVYYVVVSVYGYWRWTDAAIPRPAVSLLPLRWHVMGILGVVLVSVLTAQYLQRETQAAWPYLDSLTTWWSLFTTWLTARVKLENWTSLVCDRRRRGVPVLRTEAVTFLGLMTAVTLVVILFGHRAWWRTWQEQGRLAAPRLASNT